MAQETDKKKKLYAEEDISKLAVIKSNDTIAMKYMMCVAAASVAEGATYPLDLTKTRWEEDLWRQLRMFSYFLLLQAANPRRNSHSQWK